MSEPVCELREILMPHQRGPVPIDAWVGAGEVLLIGGASGAGKTTLLKILLGLINPRGGRVRLFGHELERLSQRALLRLRQRVGVAFEHDGLLPNWDVAENLALPLHHQRGLSARAARQRILEFARRCEFELVLLVRRVADLTGQQRRRVAIMRALIAEPELVVIDDFGAYVPADETERERLRATLAASAATLVCVAGEEMAPTFGARVRRECLLLGPSGGAARRGAMDA